jgi:type III pantothenate kinase
MNLIIDIGNSRTKFAVFDNNVELYAEAFQDCTFGKVKELKQKFPAIDKSIISATGQLPEGFIENCKSVVEFVFVFNSAVPLPFKSEYSTPQTVGLDRLAGIAGAQALFPRKNVLVIDMGTAITYDIKTSEEIYPGGNIAPGMHMRFKALNQFTHKLPLVEPSGNTTLIGDSTNSAILNGVINGIRYEIEGMIAECERNYEDLTIILTGGDAPLFDYKLKKTIFVVQNLVSVGLNSILNYNAPNS